MTGQPGLDALVSHNLCILMPTPGQRHDKDPGLEGLLALAICNQWACTEIDLRHLTDFKVELDCELRQLRRLSV